MIGVGRFLGRQARNLARIALGRRLTYTSLISATLDADDVDVAKQCLEDPSRWDEGSTVADYERAFRSWNGSGQAFAFMGGRVALSAAIDALKLGAGDEVIVPAYTCVVVANALRYAGVKPVYADIELQTYGLDARDVAARITPATKAVLLHHLYGLVCRDFEEILDLARRKKLRVIEDCAHAAGASHKGVKVGNFGDVAFYSTEHSKPFNTILGGLAVTSIDSIADGLKRYYDAAPRPPLKFTQRLLANVVLDYYRFKHARRWLLGDWEEWRLGVRPIVSTPVGEERGERPPYYGQRMPAPVAALGLNQLRKLDAVNERRRAQAAVWDDWCRRRGLESPTVVPKSTPIFLRYPVLVDPALKKDPRPIREELGVEVGGWYLSHLHPAKDDLEGFPNADRAIERCINLPTLTG
ncbi:MAG: DegT/DnrJ/EryC1/StrS family aminotransferase [Burkholderiales bacterium]